MSETLWAPREGAYGRTRDGRKTTVLNMYGDGLNMQFRGKIAGNPAAWDSTGRLLLLNAAGGHGCESHASYDLIAEWSDDHPTPSQPIDFRPGDEIEVRLRVDDLNRDGYPLVANKHGGHDLYTPDKIHRHIPAPRPLEIGKPCKLREGKCGLGGVFIYAGEFDRLAWVQQGNANYHMSVEDLTGIDDNEPTS